MVRDGRAENLAQRATRRGREELHVWHVEPDDEPEPIGEIEIEPVGNLHVAPQRVEPHGLGPAEALLEKLRARRPALFLRMPVLIERADHEERFSVQREASVLRLEFPESDHEFCSVETACPSDEARRSERKGWARPATMRAGLAASSPASNSVERKVISR